MTGVLHEVGNGGVGHHMRFPRVPAVKVGDHGQAGAKVGPKLLCCLICKKPASGLRIYWFYCFYSIANFLMSLAFKNVAVASDVVAT
jgi:hypothetical protein